MKIFAIDTSCDETSAAIVEGRKVLSSVVYSQILAHQQWGGVMPSVAKRAHEERIDWVIEKTFKKAGMKGEDIDAFAVTQGPGLAIALEVGIKKTVELANDYQKPLIAVNHMEGHIYSTFVQNKAGNPKRDFAFPYITLLVSGGHTEIVLFTDHLTYEVIGRTVDDAAGEALDKAARMLGFGYPGGPVIERLAEQVENIDFHKFPRPMANKPNLQFSFSGLKTAFLYETRALTEEDRTAQMQQLASSFQEAVFDTIIRKIKRAVMQTGINRIIVGGGVSVNKRLRNLLRAYVKEIDGSVLFPPYKYLNFDNAAMIGVAASYKYEKAEFVADIDHLDRVPRLSLPAFITFPEDAKFMKKRVVQP